MALKYQFVDYEISISYPQHSATIVYCNARCIGRHWDEWDSQAATENGPW